MVQCAGNEREPDVHESSELDILLPAEAAFQRAASAAKYLARKLSAANTLEHASTRRVAELADLLDAARALFDVTEAEAVASAKTDPSLGDTQVEEIDASLVLFGEHLARPRR